MQMELDENIDIVGHILWFHMKIRKPTHCTYKICSLYECCTVNSHSIMALLPLLCDFRSGQNQQFFWSYSSAFLFEVTTFSLSRALLLYSIGHLLSVHPCIVHCIEKHSHSFSHRFNSKVMIIIRAQYMLEKWSGWNLTNLTDDYGLVIIWIRKTTFNLMGR